MRGRGYTPRGKLTNDAYFLGQHTTSIDRRARRAAISAMGRRRYLKLLKAYRRFQKEAPRDHS